MTMTRKITIGSASLSKNMPTGTNTRVEQDFSGNDEPDARGWKSIITERLVLLSIAGPWAAWVSYTCKRRLLRRGAQLLCSGWSQKEVQHWSSYAEEATLSLPTSLHAQRHSAMAAREAEMRIKLGKRVVKHMLRRQLAAAWGHFALSVDSKRSARGVMRKVVARMQCKFSKKVLCMVTLHSKCIV